MLQYTLEENKSRLGLHISRFHLGNCYDLSECLHSIIVNDAESLFCPQYFKEKKDFMPYLVGNSHVKHVIDNYAKTYDGKPLVIPALVPTTDKWQCDKPLLIKRLAKIVRKHKYSVCKCQIN